MHMISFICKMSYKYFARIYTCLRNIWIFTFSAIIIFLFRLNLNVIKNYTFCTNIMGSLIYKV